MVLAAICLDFIEQIRKHPDTKGRAFSPLVLHPDTSLGHGILVPVKPPPPNVSPVDFYAKETAGPLPVLQETAILIKVPKHPLRIIGMNFRPPKGPANPTKPLVYLSGEQMATTNRRSRSGPPGSGGSCSGVRGSGIGRRATTRSRCTAFTG